MSADPRELIAAYLDGELAPEQERELEAWLAADPEHLKIFVRETHAHGQLRMLFKAEAAGSAPWPRSAKALGPRRHAGRAVWWLAAAVM